MTSLSSGSDGAPERKFWQLDPSLYKPGRKASILRRVKDGPRRLIGRIGSFILALFYPISLVYLGIAYGGLVFWGSFGGSLIILWLALTRSGQARNFQSADFGLKKRLAGVSIAFGVALSFVAGIAYNKLWLLSIIVIVVIVAIASRSKG